MTVMKEAKTGSWVLVVVLGVLAVLFAVFGFQQQTEASTMKEELAQSRAQVQAAEQAAYQQQKLCVERVKQAEDMNAVLRVQIAEGKKNKSE